MPHAAFNGQTPDETHFGNGDAVVIDLSVARVKARQERMKANRMAEICLLPGEGLQLLHFRTWRSPANDACPPCR